MSVSFYPFHFLLLKLLNKKINFSFPLLKLLNKVNKGREGKNILKLFSLLFFIPFHFLLLNEGLHEPNNKNQVFSIIYPFFLSSFTLSKHSVSLWTNVRAIAYTIGLCKSKCFNHLLSKLLSLPVLLEQWLVGIQFIYLFKLGFKF